MMGEKLGISIDFCLCISEKGQKNNVQICDRNGRNRTILLTATQFPTLCVNVYFFTVGN